jgi:hypothetical protein
MPRASKINGNGLLAQFLACRSELQQKRQQLAEEITTIDRLLDGSMFDQPGALFTSAPVVPKLLQPPRSARLTTNKMSLRQAVTEVLAKRGPLTKPEILTGVQKIGYVFGTKTPAASLDTLLYTHKKEFKQRAGKTFAVLNA